MCWLILPAVLILLAFLPLGLRLRYDDRGWQVRLRIGFVWFSPKRKEKRPAEKKKAGKKAGNASQKKPKRPSSEETKGGSLREFLPLARLAMEFLNDLRKKLRVKNLDVRLTLAGEDPCDLAVNYGRAWASIGNLMPLLERALSIRKRNVDVNCDFTREQTEIFAAVELVLPLYQAAVLAGQYGVRAVQEYEKLQNLRKGGA